MYTIEGGRWEGLGTRLAYGRVHANKVVQKMLKP